MKKIFLLAAATLSLASCENNDNNPDNSPEAAKIFATIGECITSRASNDQWAAGDCIGISSTVGAVGGPYVNVKYTTLAGDGVFTGTPLFFYKPMTLTAYYPFAGTENNIPGTEGIITANTDADMQTEDNQPDIDFLWDKQEGFTSSNPNVNFVFEHKMSKITFTFLKSDPVFKDEAKTIMISKGVEVSDMVAYEIKELIVDGTFDTATGVCVANKDTPQDDLGLKIEFDKGTVVNDKALRSLIVFPQELPMGYVTLRVFTDELENTDNQEYKCTLTFSNGKIEPGLHYKYRIQVTKHGLIVGENTIKTWSEEEPEKEITATIDDNKPFENN